MQQSSSSGQGSPSTAISLAARLARVRHLALDMDGTLYRGGTLFDFTLPFLARLDRLGIGYTFLTNNCSRSVRDYMAHLDRLGIAAKADQIYTSSLATLAYLRSGHPDVRRVYLVGTPSLQREFEEAGYEVTDGAEPDAVVVGFDTALTFERLCRAAWWIKQGKLFVATHPDLVCPTDKPTVLVDCGSVCACLERASGQSPIAVLGKPHPLMLAGILARHGLEPTELAMVGDRLYTDMAMARAAGAIGVLVLTGESRREDLHGSAFQPDVVVESVKELGESLERARSERRSRE
ncbi:MAG: HAD-IIA family hydrolase [Phycisphaerae bacterium]|nr:HAD-IIA family hydrolase [Phycisphaerae bacterium]